MGWTKLADYLLQKLLGKISQMYLSFSVSQDDKALNSVRITTSGGEFSCFVEACTPCFLHTD